MSDNGLQNFAMHVEDLGAAPMLDAVNDEIQAQSSLRQLKRKRATLDPETVARQYLNQFLESSAVPEFTVSDTNKGETEFKIIGTETVSLTDTKVVKFYELYHKTPIYGSLVTVELDEKHELVAINTAVGEPTGVDPIAAISPTQCQEIIRKDAGDDALPLQEPPRLYFYYDKTSNKWRLVYIAKDVQKSVREHEEESEQVGVMPMLIDYVIDAHTGELVAQLPRSQSASWERIQEEAPDGLSQARAVLLERDQTGKRRLNDPVHGVQTYDFGYKNAKLLRHNLPGSYVGNPPDPWATAAISAHANAAEVSEFLLKVLRRNGLDNQGGQFISSINCVYAGFGQPVTKEWRNAAWIGTQMIYGQRMVDGTLRSYALAKDIVAHEILHGLTDHTARLEYAFESGALNESYSDIFGIIISNYATRNIGKWNWELGEDLQGTGIPLRDLRDPTKFGQPAHMGDYQNMPFERDNGGVHINSGIHNKAAYNLINSKDNNGSYIFKRKEAAALFYLALTLHLSRTSGFSDSRRGMEIAARTLFRKDPNTIKADKLSAIAKAFDDVGIS